MGSAIAKLFRNVEARIIMVGLDAAGKTTILYKMKLGEVVTTIPTIGFNVETARYKKVQFTIWDVGGRGQIRPLWRHYMQNTSGLVFVVDSNDRDRISEAQEEISKMLSEDQLQGVPVLVLANKQDLPNAMSVAELTDKLGLHSLKNRSWYIEATCATSGDGLYEGLDWLSHQIAKDEVHHGVSSWFGSIWPGSKGTEEKEEKETQKEDSQKKQPPSQSPESVQA